MINAIGIPLLPFENENVSERNDALLKAAYLYNVPAYMYRISDISEYWSTGKIRAFFWNCGEYRDCYIDIPKYTEIYCGYSYSREHYPEIMEWLLSKTVLTDGVGLYKYDLQRKLLFSELSQYAIPTFVIQSYEDLTSYVRMFPKSFLKPYAGRQAIGAMKIEKRENYYFFSTPEGEGELTQTAFFEYYAAAGFENKTLLIEPCLDILNDDGRAVDFRCLVSLNGEGKWQNVLTYARIGGSGVAANVSHGGSIIYADRVLETLVPGQSQEKLDEMNRVALLVAEFVQKESIDPISWLGIDICIDRPSNQIYVIEANSKPGTKIVGPWPLSLVRAQYFKYLLSQSE